MPKFKRQAGAIPILLLFAALGLLIFLFISNTFDFKDKLFNKLFPKPPSHAQEVTPSVPDEILLKFKPGVDGEAKENLRKHFGVKKEDEIAQIGVEIGKVPEKAKDKIIEALSKNPRVEYAEPNYIRSAQILPDDPLFSRQRNLAQIAAPQGWDQSTGIPSAVIAVLDTGINVNHEDLAGKFIGSPAPDPDDNGHGTGVSGVAAAASNNTKGVSGVCWGCPILSIKVLDSSGSGSDDVISKGIIRTADYGAKVINMSFGGYYSSKTIEDALIYAWNKKAVLVAGAGNNNTSGLFYPAASNNVIAAGATNSLDAKASFSNYGSWVDVFAPGEAVITTTLDGSYNSRSGTSYSSPHVAGLAGLIFSANPALNNQLVVEIITSTADDLGWGKIINVTNAMAKATNTTPPPSDTIPPTISFTPPPNSGSTVTEPVELQTDAKDNIGVVQVQFLVDSSINITATDYTPPFSMYLDTAKLTNGSHVVNAAALDAAGNSTFARLYLTVNNPTSPDTTTPSVSISSPTDGSTVSGNTTISASATDNVSVSSVSLFIDGVFAGQSSSSPYTYSWNTTKEVNGSHTIYASALDSSNNQAQSSTITVNISNTVTSSPSPTPTPSSAPSPTPTPTPADTTPPTVSITNPSGTTVKAASKVNITANASDNTGISKVEFYVNGSNKCTISLNQTSYSCPWSVPGKKNTSYNISVKAYDLSNNTQSATIKVTAQ